MASSFGGFGLQEHLQVDGASTKPPDRANVLGILSIPGQAELEISSFGVFEALRLP